LIAPRWEEPDGLGQAAIINTHRKNRLSVKAVPTPRNLRNKSQFTGSKGLRSERGTTGRHRQSSEVPEVTRYAAPTTSGRKREGGPGFVSNLPDRGYRGTSQTPNGPGIETLKNSNRLLSVTRYRIRETAGKRTPCRA